MEDPALVVVTESKPKKSNKPLNTIQTYNRYIYKVLKQIHPQIGITRNSMEIMNSFINDLFERIASEAGKQIVFRLPQLFFDSILFCQ